MRAFLIVLSVVLVSAGAMAFAISGGDTGEPDPPPPQASTEFAGVLLRLGLGAEDLAAAGVTSEQVTALAATVRGNYAKAAMASRDLAFISAKRTHDPLRRKVQSGRGSAEDVTALRTAEVTLANASAARDNYLAAARRAALATVSTGQSVLLAKIHHNRHWRIPVQYLVKDRSEADWVALRDCLAAKRIHDRYGDEFDASAQTTLAAVDAEAEIATAKVDCDTRLAAVQTAWNTEATR